ncbi:hypothetical protein VTL71DRAFT_13943 [Oculimacula yallundae]|uniref:Heterokaryon incompatibility domain-containing protein n=1 Tax=Oculimacula yallundae TaxID=86028 RepID=A0ABR4CME1_9HELO
MLENEFRILDILPSDDGNLHAPIQCHVRVVCLSDKPSYDTLSYRWGNPDSTKLIQVDGQPFRVTDNLYAALLRLRCKDEKRSIWIDQICIDQKNMEEKAVQVRLMREIYSNCNQCLIWMDEIRDDVSQTDAESILGVLDWMANSDLPTPTCLASATEFEGPINALKSIAVDDHPWWKRIWTAQEVILPANKTFLWGPLQLSWDTLTRCASAWVGNGIPHEIWHLASRETGPGEIDLFMVIDRSFGWLFCNVIWINNSHAGTDEAIHTFMKWRCRKASEFRDKIFGLLGLLPPTMKLRYTNLCDYQTPIEQVYCAFTLDMILDNNGLLPLAVQERELLNNTNDQLPYWVSHMDDLEMLHQVDRYYRLWGYEDYDACGSHHLDKRALTDSLQATATNAAFRVLGVTGVAVDTITIIGTPILAPEEPARIASALRSWMEIARKYHGEIEGGLSENEFKKTFYTVLVSDCVRNSELWAVRQPDEDDLSEVEDFVSNGEGLVNGIDLWDKYVCNQTFFVTKNGMMGMGNLESEVGDEVWVFDGGRMPFSVRSRGSESPDDFTFVGCCYAHGIMEGEAYEARHDDGVGTGVYKRTIRLH